MHNINDWKDSFNQELEQAEKARSEDNEGRARVCARRAAGLAIGEYLRRREGPVTNPSAYDRLQYLISLPDIPQEAQEAARRLVLRVEPDHELPIQADLIADARLLAQVLLAA